MGVDGFSPVPAQKLKFQTAAAGAESGGIGCLPMRTDVSSAATHAERWLHPVDRVSKTVDDSVEKPVHLLCKSWGEAGEKPGYVSVHNAVDSR